MTRFPSRLALDSYAAGAGATTTTTTGAAATTNNSNAGTKTRRRHEIDDRWMERKKEVPQQLLA
jgi:hypothetical protein